MFVLVDKELAVIQTHADDSSLGVVELSELLLLYKKSQKLVSFMNDMTTFLKLFSTWH